MSIAFILRMISNTISGKGGHPQSINEEIERAKKTGGKKGYNPCKKYVRKMNWENWTVSVSLSWQGYRKNLSKEFSEIKNN